MNKAKLMSLTLAAVVLSGVLVGVAYSTFHATYESTGNTISVGDVTAISVAQLNGSNLVEATNGSFACDLTVKSTTTARTTTYSFINTGRTTANLLDAYVYQSLDGAGAATGTLTVTIETPGIDWTNVADSGITAQAGTTTATSMELEDGSITLVWDSMTVPAYSNNITTSNTLHVLVTIAALQVSNIDATSTVCNNMTVEVKLQ